MKKNITINLCGRLYQIDEDAYELLSHYMETLRNYFVRQEGGDEIADDIEQRIAELFDEQVANGCQAITIEHVQAIIEQIGKLSDITDTQSDDNQSDGTTKKTDSTNSKTKTAEIGKKFYRDTNNSMLFGVLAGAAQYMNTNVKTIRWTYVILCIIWGGISLFNPFVINFGHLSYRLYLSTFTVPLIILPELAYFILAACIPSANTPEDKLKMKGMPVNPQNLTKEVNEQSVLKQTKSNLSGWNIFIGILSIFIAIISAINLMAEIGGGGLLGFLANKEFCQLPGWHYDIIMTRGLIAAAMLFISISIILYCSIHSALSSFKKVKPMSNKQRILWSVGWLISVITFVVFLVLTISSVSDAMDRLEEERALAREEYEESHTHYGFRFSVEDWNYFIENDWKLVTSKNTERYTYVGEWMDGNDQTRYLDAFNDESPVVVSIQHTDSVQPGTYRLSAAVRSNDSHRFIFAQLDNEEEYRLKEIPVFDNSGGPIHFIARKMSGLLADDEEFNLAEIDPDGINQERLKQKSKNTILSISVANNECGYGWSYIAISDIVVTQPSQITYGLTTDEAITGVEPATGWFSATDFKLEKIK